MIWGIASSINPRNSISSLNPISHVHVGQLHMLPGSENFFNMVQSLSTILSRRSAICGMVGPSLLEFMGNRM